MIRRRPYPSDITDAQWKRISSLIPTDRNLGRRRSTELREIVNAINYRWQTGIVWRMLPHDFPPWATVYTYFRQWQKAGCLRAIRDVILKRKSSLKKASSSPERGTDSAREEAKTVSPKPSPKPNPPVSSTDAENPHPPAEKKSQGEIPFPKECLPEEKAGEKRDSSEDRRNPFPRLFTLTSPAG